VSFAYEWVNKYYKDTTFHERQLRDMKSYMEQGTELYEQVQDMLPVADAVGGEETNSPIT
jgi:hypothetical protein